MEGATNITGRKQIGNDAALGCIGRCMGCDIFHMHHADDVIERFAIDGDAAMAMCSAIKIHQFFDRACRHRRR